MRTRLFRTMAVVVGCLLPAGCQVLHWGSAHVQPSEPPLPQTMSCAELVDYLNRQSGGLHAWQSTKVRMTVRMPRQLPLRFDGHIACQSPNRFHLTASNVVASADLGSNDERCWVLMKPFDTGTISWRHEDAHLVQDLPSGIPWIDPDWLMLVLGVKRLNADDYELSRHGERELWLTATGRAAGSGISRYVIKVDRARRIIREHAAYDRQGRLVVRAVLDRHRRFDGHLLPTWVRLEFPISRTQMHLSFRDIETNPLIASAHWEVPSDPYAQNIDLGELLASRSTAPQYALLSDAERHGSEAVLPEPEWSPSPAESWPRRPVSETRDVSMKTGRSFPRTRRPSLWRRVLDPFNLTGSR